MHTEWSLLLICTSIKSKQSETNQPTRQRFRQAWFSERIGSWREFLWTINNPDGTSYRFYPQLQSHDARIFIRRLFKE